MDVSQRLETLRERRGSRPMTAPNRIWIEEDHNPYYYEENDKDEATSPVTEYVRADLVDELVQTLQDATHYGIGIMQGGKRIAPKDFYTQPDPDQYRREGFQAGIEAAARITEGGYCCRSCGQVFLNDNGHSDADCSQGYPDWDTATDTQKADAIRALDVDKVLAGLPTAPDVPDDVAKQVRLLRKMTVAARNPLIVADPLEEVASRAADTIEAQAAELARLVKAAKALRPYLRWTIGPESPGHHPTMPSAVDAFLFALAAMETSHDQ